MVFTINRKNLYRKRRYKPLYKQFIELKKNVQYRRKIFFNYFKKLKWQKFLRSLKIRTKSPQKNYILIDHNRYSIFTFFKLKFKKKFGYKRLAKKKISLFYGGLLKKYFRRALIVSKKTFQLVNTNFLIIEIFEKRLDSVLYRSHFTNSIRGARQLIIHGHVFVNKKLVTTNSYVLKQGDFIEINKKFHNLIENNLKSTHKWPVPPKYLQINYKTFQIIFHDNIQLTNLSTHFPFKLDLNTINKLL
jgi:small subunit ribosomal protein S4